MLDFIYLLASVGFFFGSVAYARWCEKSNIQTISNYLHSMGTIILGVIASLLFVYLFATMIYPEKF